VSAVRDAAVAQAIAHALQVDALRDQDRGGRVPNLVQPKCTDPRLFDDGPEAPSEGCGRPNGAAVVREDQIEVFVG
jgi:hypothetical protein